MHALTPETFATLFTREGLRPFQPRPGAEGLMPMLEVHTPTDVLVFVLALDGFNDTAIRHHSLRTLGHTVAAEAHEAVAVRFGSEAWRRTFTPAEYATRDGRLVETYPDKEECIVVMGQMADGPGMMASARLYRRAHGEVERLGEWTVIRGADQRSPLLDAFWQGYHAGQAEAEA